MTRSPIFYFALGAGSFWAFHKFIKPVPGKTSSSS